MKNDKYNLFIAILTFTGLVIAVGLLISVLLLFNVFFTEGIGDLLFFPQFLILGAVFFSIFPIIMILISNVYFKTTGKKTWGNWLNVSLHYEAVFTVIAVYQSAFVVIELLVFVNNIDSSGVIDKIIMFTFPFIMFFLSKKILKKLFGLAAVGNTSEKNDEEEIDANDFIIRQPIYALVWYIVITIMFFSILCVWIFTIGFDSLDDLIGLLILSPLILLGPFLIILWSRWKMIIKDNQITSTPYFGRTKSFTFDYITRVKHGVNYTKMGTIDYIKLSHEKEKLFSLTSICPGYQVFVQRLKDGGAPIEW